MKKGLLIICLFLAGTTFCQDELDKIFDDGLSNRNLRICSDVTTLAGGTVAAFIDYHPERELSFRAGAGFMPFGYQIDLSNINKSLPVLDKTIKVGYYLQAAFAYHYKFCWNQPFDIYHLFGYERWQFNADNGFNVRRTKVEVLSVGFGCDVGLKWRIDTRFGIYGGIDKARRELSESSGGLTFRGKYFPPMHEQKTEILTGLDASFEISFKL